MMLSDVNVLIGAFRPDAIQHPICRAWLDMVVAGRSRFGLSPLALSAVVRITTSSRIFKTPSTSEEAFAFCDDLLQQPHAQIVEPGDRHWAILRQLCAEADVKGPLVSDAWFAALAIEWGCEWITLDRDYARFKGLKWRAPRDDELPT